MDIKIVEKTKLDLDQFLYVWFNALPENHARIRIFIGQQQIIFPIECPLVTDEIGLFSEPNGGKLVARIPISTSNKPLPVRVDRGDRILYTLDWSNF